MFRATSGDYWIDRRSAAKKYSQITSISSLRRKKEILVQLCKRDPRTCVSPSQWGSARYAFECVRLQGNLLEGSRWYSTCRTESDTSARSRATRLEVQRFVGMRQHAATYARVITRACDIMCNEYMRLRDDKTFPSVSTNCPTASCDARKINGRALLAG